MTTSTYIAQALTGEEIKQLQQTLERQKHDILSHGKNLRTDLDTNKDDLLDEVDLALADVAQGMKMRLGNRESLYFKKLEDALFRLKEGIYGQCSECGGPIGFKRLEARPTAESCIDCKESAEKNETLNAEGRKHKSLGELFSFKGNS